MNIRSSQLYLCSDCEIGQNFQFYQIVETDESVQKTDIKHDQDYVDKISDKIPVIIFLVNIMSAADHQFSLPFVEQHMKAFVGQHFHNHFVCDQRQKTN